MPAKLHSVPGIEDRPQVMLGHYPNGLSHRLFCHRQAIIHQYISRKNKFFSFPNVALPKTFLDIPWKDFEILSVCPLLTTISSMTVTANVNVKFVKFRYHSLDMLAELGRSYELLWQGLIVLLVTFWTVTSLRADRPRGQRKRMWPLCSLVLWANWHKYQFTVQRDRACRDVANAKSEE